jgi:YfiH family protein
LSKAGFVHAFSMRANGNLSENHGEAAVFADNRRQFLQEVGQADWPVRTLKQTHSDNIVVASEMAQTEGDALVSSQTGEFIGIKTADCVPVLIGDPVTRAMAAVHAGWRGTLQRIVEKTIDDMASRFGSKADDLIAVIGPAACGRCYEVENDVASQFTQEFSDTRAFLLPSSSEGKFLLNVPAANATQLIRLKVRAENVQMLPYCTMHQHDLFFSHRKDSAGGVPGARQLSVIGRP